LIPTKQPAHIRGPRRQEPAFRPWAARAVQSTSPPRDYLAHSANKLGQIAPALANVHPIQPSDDGVIAFLHLHIYADPKKKCKPRVHKDMPEKQILRVKEPASFLGVKPSVVYKLADQGLIPC
jgi:hypothetical protein